MDKKTMKFYLLLAAQIIAMGVFGMLYSFFGDYLHNSGFFGDTICVTKQVNYFTDPNIDWGIRHYYYFWMCFLIVCLAIIRLIHWAIIYNKENE